MNNSNLQGEQIEQPENQNDPQENQENPDDSQNQQISPHQITKPEDVWDIYLLHQESVNEVYENLQGKDENNEMDENLAQKFLNEISIIMNYNCEDCLLHLKTNGPFSEKQSIGLEEFNHYFQQWCREQPPLDQDAPQQEEQPALSNYDDQVEDNVHKSHNRMLIETFLKYNNNAVEAYFVDYSQEKKGMPKVFATEIPLVMRIAFYIDNITFHRSKEDVQEYFTYPDSNKQIIFQIYNFMNKYQLGDDINSLKLNYVQFLQFVDFFIQKEQDVYLRINKEQQLDDQPQDDNLETDLQKELKANIKKYEDMAENAKNTNEKQVINNMLMALYDQLSRIKQAPTKNNRKLKKKMTKQEQRSKNLREIFEFYCKQQYYQNSTFTLERVLHESHVMNISNFLLFCKQFKITNYVPELSKTQLPIIFKKQSYKELEFDEFKLLCEKMALIMFKDSQEFISEPDKLEAFYKFIGIDNSNFYKNVMHLLNNPFNIQEKDGFRFLPKDQGRVQEMHRIDSKLQEELEKRKKEREFLIKKFISLTPQPLKKQISNHDLPHLQKVIQPSYFQKNMQLQLKKQDVSGKVSWQQLQEMKYGNVQGGKFKPADLVDIREENDDQNYFQQFSFMQDNLKNQMQQQQNRVKQEQYGQIGNFSKNNGKQKSYGQYSVDINQQGGGQNRFYQQPRHQTENDVGHQYNKNLIGQNYMQRANEIDAIQKKKEAQMMQQIQGQQKNGLGKKY